LGFPSEKSSNIRWSGYDIIAAQAETSISQLSAYFIAEVSRQENPAISARADMI
jgi:hypothetical protein